MKIKLFSFYKVFIKITLTSLIIASIFFLYFFAIGIPKTQARTYYNLAITALKNNQKVLAKNYFEKSINYWREQYIVDAYNNSF